VPEEKRLEVLHRFHDHKLAGHLGITKTLNRNKPKFIWPKMKSQISEYVATCDICQKRKVFTNKKASLQSLPLVNRLWERIACDLVGPIKTINQKYEYILTILEYETRFAKAIPLKVTDSATIAKVIIINVILEHSLPSQILTDRGTNLIAGAMQEICESLNIEQIKTSPYHPQTNGLVKKFNGTLGNMLSAYANQKPSTWPSFLKYAVFAYNTSVHASTKETPFYLLYGHDPLEPFELTSPTRSRTTSTDEIVFHSLWREARDLAKLHLEAAQANKKYYYDRDILPDSPFGDKVIVREVRVGLGKFHLRWDGPFTIVKKLSPVNYSIKKENSLTDIVVHVNRLRHYRERKSSLTDDDSSSESDNSVSSDSSIDSQISLPSQRFDTTSDLDMSNSQLTIDSTQVPTENSSTWMPSQASSSTQLNHTYSGTPSQSTSKPTISSQVCPLAQPSHSTQSLPANIRPFTLIPRVVLERLLPEQFERPTSNPSPQPLSRAQTSRYPIRRRQPPKRFSN